MRWIVLALLAGLAWAEEKPPVPDVKIQLRIVNLEKVMLQMEIQASAINAELRGLKAALAAQCGDKYELKQNVQTGEQECAALPVKTKPEAKK